MKKSKVLITTALSCALLLSACGNKEANNKKNATNNNAVVESTEEAKVDDGAIVLHRGYVSPHGDKSFGRIIVATSGDKIIATNIDEFQFLDAADVKLPNTDKEFGKGFADGKILASKRLNNELYSKTMAEKGGATKTLLENYEAIENFVKGKTIAEVEKVAKEAKPGEPVDAVSGATLADTVGYLNAIVETAKDTKLATTAPFEGNVEDLKLAQAYTSNGEDKYVTDAVVLKDQDKIVAANIDELFFMEKGIGVPNSDKAFAEGYKDAKTPLVSKKVNNEAYSKAMKENGKATKTIMENYKAIEDFAVGKTPDEIKKVVSEAKPGEAIDAVSGATLAGTGGLLTDITDAK